jgi:nickel transport protein
MTVYNTKLIIIIVFILILPTLIFAHGITRTIEQGNGMIVTALYDDGKPISYALIKIYPPGSRTVEYQNGRTDVQGRFSFIPSAPGDWLVRLDDGMGHGFEELVKVDAKLHGTSTSPVMIKLGQKIIVFLLLSWGGVMTVLYMRKRVNN